MSTSTNTKNDKIREILVLAGFTDETKKQIEQGFTLAKNSPLFKGSYEKHFNWVEFEELVIPFYDNHFTEEEIDGIIEFYGSDIGNKILNFNGGGSSDMMKTLDTWVSERYNAVMDEMTKPIA